MMPPPKPAAVLIACLLVAIVLATVRQDPAVAQAPTDFYASAQSLTGTALRQELHRLAALNHKKRSLDFVEERILEVADEDPDNPANVIDVYLNLSMPKDGSPKRPWQTEHAWPVSFGFDREDIGEDCNVPYADAHHLFVSHPSANGSEGHWNRRFDDCPPGVACHFVPAAPSGEVRNLSGPDTWEVWRGRRGDIARSILYMDIRYEGGPTSADKPTGEGTCHDEPDLQLTDEVDDIHPTGGITSGVAVYGNLQALIRWTFEDPVDDRERARNDVIARRDLQGNRNPFVDRPDFICRVLTIGRCTALWLPFVAK